MQANNKKLNKSHRGLTAVYLLVLNPGHNCVSTGFIHMIFLNFLVVGVAGGVMIIVLAVGILGKMYRKHRRNSLGEPEVVCVAAEQTTRRQVPRDPEVPEVQTSDIQTLDSAPSTLQTGRSTESGHLGE